MGPTRMGLKFILEKMDILDFAAIILSDASDQIEAQLQISQ